MVNLCTRKCLLQYCGQNLILLAALVMIVVFALAGTVGAFSSIFYKGTQCDFNAILICTAIGCTLLFGLVFACVLISAPKLRTVAYINVIASVPGLMLLTFAIYGTVSMSSSKTCQATSKKGATTLIGNLYETTHDLVGSSYVIVCLPLVMACAEKLGMKIGTSSSGGSGYGSGYIDENGHYHSQSPEGKYSEEAPHPGASCTAMAD